ncbi:hypothetical protein [Microbulbifer aggregans]|uniref:hypothetical protein n=1 Tax=Microbulbifer aggregans TaxID=1769779 RepID=UPI001CFEEA2D|nr:hypothetical protein [Microbulbifer aggregans]
MKDLYFSAIFLVSFFSSFAFGQTTVVQDQTAAEWLSERFDLKQSVTDPTKSGKPASITFISPAGGESSQSIDMAIKFVKLDLLASKDATDLIPFVEYHRNTALSTPQNSLQAGFSLHHIQTLNDASLWYWLDLGYMEDRESDISSNYVKAWVSPLSSSLSLGAANDWFGPGSIRWGFATGVQYFDSPDIAKSGTPGTAHRAAGQLDFLWVPPSQSVENPFRIELVQNYWAMTNRDSGFEEIYGQEQSLFTATARYKLGDYASVAVVYSEGENPETDKMYHETTTISLEFSL